MHICYSNTFWPSFSALRLLLKIRKYSCMDKTYMNFYICIVETWDICLGTGMNRVSENMNQLSICLFEIGIEKMFQDLDVQYERVFWNELTEQREFRKFWRFHFKLCAYQICFYFLLIFVNEIFSLSCTPKNF